MALRKKTDTAKEEVKKNTAAPGALEDTSMPDDAPLAEGATEEMAASEEPVTGAKVSSSEPATTKEKLVEELGTKPPGKNQPVEQHEENAPAGAVVTTKRGGEMTAAGRPVMQAALSKYENLIPPVDFGVLPRLLASNGCVMGDENEEVGKVITIQLASFNKNYVITPADKSDQARSLVRFSHNADVIDGSGELVADYLKDLREAGYPNACIKEYCDLLGILHAVDGETDHDLIDSMVLVQLAPQSRKQFEGYRLQSTVKVQMGRETEEALTMVDVSAHVKTLNSNTFTMFKMKKSSFILS